MGLRWGPTLADLHVCTKIIVSSPVDSGTSPDAISSDVNFRDNEVVASIYFLNFLFFVFFLVQRKIGTYSFALHDAELGVILLGIKSGAT